MTDKLQTKIATITILLAFTLPLMLGFIPSYAKGIVDHVNSVECCMVKSSDR